jgi:hypothetical protein
MILGCVWFEEVAWRRNTREVPDGSAKERPSQLMELSPMPSLEFQFIFVRARSSEARSRYLLDRIRRGRNTRTERGSQQEDRPTVVFFS